MISFYGVCFETEFVDNFCIIRIIDNSRGDGIEFGLRAIYAEMLDKNKIIYNKVT